MIKMFDKNTIIMFLNREHLLQSSLLCLCVVVTHIHIHTFMALESNNGGCIMN